MSAPPWLRASEWLAAGTRENARMAVLGVPTQAAASVASGAHTTPGAIRAALAGLSTYSGDVDLADVISVVDLGDVVDPDEHPEGIAAALGGLRARLLVVLGGDSSLTAPTVHAVRADALVTIGAHQDVRKGHGAGSPVRRLLAAGLPGERVVQVGIASWASSRAFDEEAGTQGVTVMTRDEVARQGIDSCMTRALEKAAGRRVHVDLDLDVCDRSVVPACPASLPGGLSAREVLCAARLAGRNPRVVSIGITEVDATADPDGRTVGLAAMCLLEVAAGMAERSP